MKIRALIAMLALCGASAAGAATAEFDSFTLSYNDATVFGSLSSTFSSSGNVVGFTWSFPDSVNVVSLGGFPESSTFALPDFTITAKNGYSLSGLSASVGNLAFTEVAGANTSVTAFGSVAVNGGPDVVVGGLLNKTTTASNGTAYATGYYSGSASAGVGTFSSLVVHDGTLVLGASGGAFASITANPQNELKFSLIAAAVPEPENYAMFLAGLGLIGMIARRGKYQG